MQCTLYLSLIWLVSLLHLLLRSIMSNLSQVIQRFYISSENDVTTSLAPLWFHWVWLDSYGTFKSQTIIFSKLGPFSCSVELQHILIATLGLKQTPFSHKFTSLTSVQFIFIKLSQRWTRRRDCARWLNSPWGTCVSAIFLLQFLSVPALEKKNNTQHCSLFQSFVARSPDAAAQDVYRSEEIWGDLTAMGRFRREQPKWRSLDWRDGYNGITHRLCRIMIAISGE